AENSSQRPWPRASALPRGTSFPPATATPAVYDSVAAIAGSRGSKTVSKPLARSRARPWRRCQVRREARRGYTSTRRRQDVIILIRGWNFPGKDLEFCWICHSRYGLAVVYSHRFCTLPTGMRQRVCTMRYIFGEPELARVELSMALALYRAMAVTFWLPQAEAALAQMA